MIIVYGELDKLEGNLKSLFKQKFNTLRVIKIIKKQGNLQACLLDNYVS